MVSANTRVPAVALRLAPLLHLGTESCDCSGPRLRRGAEQPRASRYHVASTLVLARLKVFIGLVTELGEKLLKFFDIRERE